jgi:hemoglobin
MLKLSGPIWISVYDVADVFDLPPRMAGRSRTGGLVAVQAVGRGGVYRHRLRGFLLRRFHRRRGDWGKELTLRGMSGRPGSGSLFRHPWEHGERVRGRRRHKGLLRLAEAWHSRVMADEVVGHAFSHGFHPRHSERLAAYFRSPRGADHVLRYLWRRDVGRTDPQRQRPTPGKDRRAIACFDQALDDVGLNAIVRQTLHDYFTWATTTTMARYHESAADVPDVLSIPDGHGTDCSAEPGTPRPS